MRIVHTSDWHAGRTWKGIQRLAELGEVLDHLGDFLEREKIELLLMSGDIFDTSAPPPEAEKLVFSFFKRIGQAGIPSVVIAGNHDSPTRVQAWGTLAELVGVHALGLPRKADDGGVIPIESASGDLALVAAVPFAPVHRMVTALDLAGAEKKAKRKYDLMMREIFSHLAARFTEDTTNVLMAHTHLAGVSVSGSEREVHLSEQWETTPNAFPSSAHYVALGHIHRPQKVEQSSVPACYAGSPLQLDFGEEGEEKTFVVVEVEPGRPAQCEWVAYEGGEGLRTVRSSLESLERDQEQLARSDWLRVRVPLGAPDPDINGKVRRLLPNAVVVEVELPEPPEEVRDERPPPGSPPRELYRAYSMAQYGDEPDSNLLDTFDRLYIGSDED
jgi:exonuclease SbcD